MVVKIIGTIWRMSVKASILILFILAVRPFLKRYPKIYSYVLWIFVGISLLFPMSISSPFSLQPNLPESMAFLEGSQDIGTKTLAPSEKVQNPAQTSGLSSENTGAFGTSHGQSQTAMQPDGNLRIPAENGVSNPDDKPENQNLLLRLFCILYLAGLCIVSLCCITQYLRVRRRIASAVLEGGNVWLCEAVQSPFVIGIRKPRILLPYTLAEAEKSYILRHEKTHIRHHDPLARVIVLVCICLHWWNPFVWLASHFMEQDMEMFCDESTMQYANLNERKAYAKTLLSCAGRQSGLAVGLAFGESNTERRVKNIMKKRKNNLIVLFCVILLSVFCVAAFMTIPKAAEDQTKSQEAPVYFDDFALNDGVVYKGHPENEIEDALPLPVSTDYCAIYNNELYYTTDYIERSIDHVVDGHLTIYCCGLDGTNQRKLLDLPEIYTIMDMALRDGYLYCAYHKTENDDKIHIAKVQTSGEGLTEYEFSGEYGGLMLFWKDRAYSRSFGLDGNLIFYIHYLETGETKELYRCSGYFFEDYCVWNGKLLLLLYDNEDLTLFSVDEDRNIKNYGSYTGSLGRLLSGKSTYCSIDTALYRLDEKEDTWIPLENILPEGVESHTIFLLGEEGDDLYYTVSGEVPDNEWYNTFLVQYNTVLGQNKLLRTYYTP